MEESKDFEKWEWFEHHFGFDETLESVYKEITVQMFPDHAEVFSKANNKKYNAGKFSLKNVSMYSDLPKRGNGKFHLIHGYGKKKPHSQGDIITLQNDPNNNGATFLAASNFNCLEFPSDNFNASMGISGYGPDPTQGPQLALCSPGATLYRNYFVPHDDVFGQVEKEIQLLQKTPLPVFHGKVIFNEEEELKLQALNFQWNNPCFR